MKTVWKYKIDMTHLQTLQMPEGAQVLSLQKQGSRSEDDMFLWCLVNTDRPMRERTFVLVGTGESIDDLPGAEYVATMQFIRGVYVYHLFELKKG